MAAAPIPATMAGAAPKEAMVAIIATAVPATTRVVFKITPAIFLNFFHLISRPIAFLAAFSASS